MRDTFGTERYCFCPMCRTRYPFPATLENNLVLIAIDTEDRALVLHDTIFCGKCGAGFRPDVETHIDRHHDELTAEVHYIPQKETSPKPRWKHNLPPTHVPCEVSGRWLRFHPDSSNCAGGEFIHVDVMTTATTPEGSDRDRKLCELVVTREDLERALDTVRPREQPRTSV